LRRDRNFERRVETVDFLAHFARNVPEFVSNECVGTRRLNMRVVAIFNHKGGCGKTTTAINLASSLAEAKRRVLLVDLDPQAHSTVGCGVREEDVELSTWDILKAAGEANPIGLPDIAWEIGENFFLAPATVGLATVEQALAGADGRDQHLKRLIDAARDRYDFVVIDCGPGLGLLSANALMAATEVLVPVDLGFFSIYGLRRTLDAVEMVAERTQRRPEVHILPTMYDTRARTMRRTLAALRDEHGAAVLETVIRFNVDLREAAALGSPVAEFKPGCRGHEDYRALAQELASMGLQLEYEVLVEAEPAEIQRQEAQVDTKVAAVYGAIPIRGGVRFVCRMPEAKHVQVAGDFNQWTPVNGNADLAPATEPGVWQKDVRLTPGRYAYRLVVDGQWMSDPANPYVESNPYGELNSVVEVS
jgi:chromosome partitioning protein